MKQTLFFVILLVFITTNTTLAQSDKAKLTKVTIVFSTHNDNKDHDTRLSVSIKNKTSIFLSREVAKGDNIGGDMEFVDPSTHSFDLVLSSDNQKVSDLTMPIVAIDIQPNGNDRWIFDYIVKLSFDDGVTYTSKSQGVILDQDNRHYEGVFSN